MGRKKKTSGGFLKLILLVVVFALFAKFVIIDSGYTSSFSENLINEYEGNNQASETIDDNYFYRVYFCPEDDCTEKLEEYIQEANKIRCSVYEANLEWFYNSLKEKVDNGKKVLFITDDKQLEKVKEDLNGLESFEYLLENDYILEDSRKGDYMHNKFCVFDDNLLWLGSFNFTHNADQYNNNNVIVTDNENLIQLANVELDEQESGIFNGGEINPEQENYPKLYFCPEDDCAGKYLEILENAEERVWCMFFSFTYDPIGDRMVELHNQGLSVKTIFEARQNSQYSEFSKFEDAGVDVLKDQNPKTMHNKFCIIDDYLITGSMNPSNHSQEDNDESILILNNKEITNKYDAYFQRYWSMWS
jgi:phosphatidylserine/phosphatidylglycerophosphate/cardiolipin synthase-like enzyme